MVNINKILSKENQYNHPLPEIPKGMTIVIDSNEQVPWLFKPHERYRILHGDYSIQGFEDVFTIERKANDIFAYIGKDRKKTNRKLQAMSEYEVALLIIEGFSWDDIVSPQEYSRVAPEAVVAFFTKALNVRYKIPWFMHRDPRVCMKVALDAMVYYYELKMGLR